MITLFVDLETRPDPAMGPYRKPDDFPPPPYHMVTTYAWLAVDSGREARGPGDVHVMPSATFGVAQGERFALRTFAEHMAQKPRLVTWNGRGFDLPVIAIRSMRHQIPQRALLTSKPDYLYRYTNAAHCNLMDQVSLLGAGPRCRLDDVARCLGLPGKHVGSGDEVEQMTPEQEAAYCFDDVAQMALVYCEWRRVQGYEVEPQRDMILDAIEREDRLAALHTALTEIAP